MSFPSIVVNPIEIIHPLVFAKVAVLPVYLLAMNTSKLIDCFLCPHNILRVAVRASMAP